VLRALAAFQEGGSSYWLDDVGIRRAALRERTGAEATIRASVRALFGEAATAKPEFRNLFYPLGENFNFLDSDQQLAVRDWERERSLAARSDQRHPAEERPCAASPASPATHCANAAAPPGVRANLPDFLSAELQFEYSLRRSPLAARLRAAGLDEQSFRAAYRLLNAVVSGSGARDQLRAREQLQSMIGFDRTDRLLMPFDPAFQSIAGILEQAGVARPRLLVVYSIVARANETVLDILTSAPAGADTTATSREIARIKRNERMQLEELLSSEVVARILSARQRIGAIDDPAAFCRAAA
jgi:hypothetical protein